MCRGREASVAATPRERIDDWRAFLDSGLDPEAHAALRAAERTGTGRLL